MNAMKKMFKKMKKTKKKDKSMTVNYSTNEIHKDAVPDAPRNLKIEIPKRSELYRNFRIDNCKESLNGEINSTHHQNFNSLSSEREESFKYSCSSSFNSEAVPIDDINGTQRTLSSPETGIQNLAVESRSSLSEGSSSEELRQNDADLLHSGSESSNESETEDENEVVQSLNSVSSGDHNEHTTSNSRSDNEVNIQKKKERKKKNSTVVISISNSSNFQIGSQKNVFMNGSPNNNFSIPSVQNKVGLKNGNKKSKIQEILNQSNGLLNVKRSVTDKEIRKIASNMDDKWILDNWKQLGTDLGLDEQDLDNIEISSNGNPKIIVFDAIKTLKEKKQDSSVKFITEVLIKFNQIRAIEQLTA